MQGIVPNPFEVVNIYLWESSLHHWYCRYRTRQIYFIWIWRTGGRGTGGRGI